MSILLHIETSTTVCSVALSNEDKLLALEEINEGYSHAENLSLLIEKIFRDTGYTFHDLKAIAVSKGPGSYTGLRIGVSTAKGLAYSLGIPLIAVDTLQAMAYDENVMGYPFKIPMLDARRMEVYMAVYDASNQQVQDISAEIIDETYFNDEDRSMVLFGPGAEKCRELIADNPTLEVVSGVLPSAKNMVQLGYNRYRLEQFEDTAYFEPFYLKDFVAGKPKKML